MCMRMSSDIAAAFLPPSFLLVFILQAIRRYTYAQQSFFLRLYYQLALEYLSMRGAGVSAAGYKRKNV